MKCGTSNEKKEESKVGSWRLILFDASPIERARRRNVQTIRKCTHKQNREVWGRRQEEDEEEGIRARKTNNRPKTKEEEEEQKVERERESQVNDARRAGICIKLIRVDRLEEGERVRQQPEVSVTSNRQSRVREGEG
jgi:hypothetical protein